jgi:hypothetical protein
LSIHLSLGFPSGLFPSMSFIKRNRPGPRLLVIFRKEFIF